MSSSDIMIAIGEVGPLKWRKLGDGNFRSYRDSHHIELQVVGWAQVDDVPTFQPLVLDSDQMLAVPLWEYIKDRPDLQGENLTFKDRDPI